ncbi:MAG: hypothetical protein CVT81_09430 [Alphaproteobacteria bacterium HGW-Alphaproteobacteria-3]|nr:MAG: hypothetical protein CVT81_09430 [Alphaproteobacteria bacterium HGW-Alphaproteobacteria-3]
MRAGIGAGMASVPRVAIFPFFAAPFLAFQPPQRRAFLLKADAVVTDQLFSTVDRALLVIAIGERLRNGGRVRDAEDQREKSRQGGVQARAGPVSGSFVQHGTCLVTRWR